MPRLFTAIDLPEDIRLAVTGIGKDLPGARCVPQEQLHLTLRFIGDVDDVAFAAVRPALAKVCATPFALTLRGIGHFPPGRHPRVLWIGLDGSAPLMALQQDVELALVGAGIPPEERSFSPHLTLARLKDTPPHLVAGLEERFKDFTAGPFPVTEFHLYSSTLTHNGAIHTREEIYRFIDEGHRHPVVQSPPE